MSKLLMLSAIELTMNPMVNPYMDTDSKERIDPSDIDVIAGRDILIHNKEQLYTFTIHGVEIQAPNKKAAIKIYNRKHSKKK